MRDQLVKLLGQGATREEAIRITGASEDLVTELLKDAGFLAEVKGVRDTNRQELIEQGYAKLEQATISKITKELDYADIPSLCRVLETTAKNRVLHRNPAGHFTNPTLHLSVEVRLPAGANAEKVVIDNNTNQIVAIGNRNMSGMPMAGVQKLFKSLEEQKIEAKSGKHSLTPQEEVAIIDADLDNDTHSVMETSDDTSSDQARTVARAA